MKVLSNVIESTYAPSSSAEMILLIQIDHQSFSKQGGTWAPGADLVVVVQEVICTQMYKQKVQSGPAEVWGWARGTKGKSQMNDPKWEFSMV